MSDDGEHPHDARRYGGRGAGQSTGSGGRRDADGRGEGGAGADGWGVEGGGRLVDGRYRLTERIGSGGTGTVWKAVDQLVEREVAVKQPRLPGGSEYPGVPVGSGPPPDGPDDPENEERRRTAHRLYREARAAAHVDHPSAVTIHDVVIEDGHPWIVMEWVRGESLHEALRRGPLTPAECARIGLAVVGALHAGHSVGIVHRDVKPANVLLGPHGRVVLTDFGTAHVQSEGEGDGEGDGGGTRTAGDNSVGSVGTIDSVGTIGTIGSAGSFDPAGSLEFVAPERVSGRTAGPPSDLWSLGALLYAAVEGTSPFRRTTPESTRAAILSADPPPPEHAGPLAPLLLRLLTKDPGSRPDADEVTAALKPLAEGRPAPGPTEPQAPPTTGRVPSPARKRRVSEYS